MKDCCVDEDKYKLNNFRNFMVYLGKHTMPVFLFKGEKKTENLDYIKSYFSQKYCLNCGLNLHFVQK